MLILFSWSHNRGRVYVHGCLTVVVVLLVIIVLFLPVLLWSGSRLRRKCILHLRR